jgi:hypothetical protein
MFLGGTLAKTVEVWMMAPKLTIREHFTASATVYAEYCAVLLEV